VQRLRAFPLRDRESSREAPQGVRPGGCVVVVVVVCVVVRVVVRVVDVVVIVVVIVVVVAHLLRNAANISQVLSTPSTVTA